MLPALVPLLCAASCSFTTHDVPASATDPAIDGDRPTQPNRTWAPRTGRRHQLLVHFPGSDGSTAASRRLAAQMAAAGFHVIDLAYDPSHVTVRSTCREAVVRTDPRCWLDFRGERFYGAGRYDNPAISVDRAHSVMNRLIKLLGYLRRAHPAEGWGKFVSSERNRAYGGRLPRFDRMLASGHSQGAGMALFMGRERRLLRVGMFGGANDFAPRARGGVVVAPWIRGRFATPARRIYGFSHTRETGHAGQLALWAALRLPGRPTSVDGAGPPYGGSHRLVTSRQPRCGARCVPNDFHSSTVVDAVTPLDAPGRPAFAPVWRTMLVPPR